MDAGKRMPGAGGDAMRQLLYAGISIWLGMTALAGDAMAQARRSSLDVGEVAYFYARTLLQKKDASAGHVQQAEHWLRTAIRLGEGRAALQLAKEIEDGVIPVAGDVRQQTIDDLRRVGIALRKVLAEQGDDKVATEVGLAYLYGRGVTRSPQDALHWIERAAKGGQPRALMELSRMVRWGAVPAYAPKDSIPMLEKSAEKRFATAVRELGEIYVLGHLVEIDPVQALRYFEQGASFGNAESMRRTGLAYIGGFGVKRDSGKGREFLARAAAAGNEAAMYNLAMLYRFPPEGMQADPARYIEWLQKAAEVEQADAQYLLGMAYLKGEGVRKDPAQARRLIAGAAGQGYFPAEVAQEQLSNETP